MNSLYSLPVTITCGGQELPIRGRGDYRIILDVIAALDDWELEEDERAEAALTIFLDCDLSTVHDLQGACVQMADFISAGGKQGKRTNKKLMDWQDDAAHIISGINRVLGQEIRALPYLHWWTFVAAYMEIGDGTLAMVISIREKLANGRKLEKYERQYYHDHPEEFEFSSDKARKERERDEIMEIWNDGS